MASASPAPMAAASPSAISCASGMPAGNTAINGRLFAKARRNASRSCAEVNVEINTRDSFSTPAPAAPFAHSLRGLSALA